MRKFLTFVLFFLTLFIAGCASPMKAPADKDTEAKDFTPNRHKAALYIYRNENFGGAIGMPVAVNGHSLGETGAKTFFRLNLASGTYVITSEAENTAQLPLNLTEGQNYFVWQEVRMGIWKARNSLRQVDESAGQAGVLESFLLQPATSEDVLSKSGTTKK